jgi:hypothetical protein
MGKKHDPNKKKGCKKCGRNKRPVRYPLMPQFLTVSAAQRWFRDRYEK